MLTVEDPQRIGMQTPAAVFIQHTLVRGEILDQRLAKSGARQRASKRIELQRNASYVQPPPQPRRHEDKLRIDVWTWHAEGLDTSLVELPVPACLDDDRALHPALVPEPLGLIVE